MNCYPSDLHSKKYWQHKTKSAGPSVRREPEATTIASDLFDLSHCDCPQFALRQRSRHRSERADRWRMSSRLTVCHGALSLAQPPHFAGRSQHYQTSKSCQQGETTQKNTDADGATQGKNTLTMSNKRSTNPRQAARPPRTTSIPFSNGNRLQHRPRY